MERPEVRIIEPQQSEIKDAQILDWEVQQLMQKYNIQQPPQQSIPTPPNNDLTFEEMVQLEERRLRQEAENRKMRHEQSQQNNGPRINYVTDDDTGFNYRIEIRMEGLEPPKY